MKRYHEKTIAELREFGLFMALVCNAFVAVSLWRAHGRFGYLAICLTIVGAGFGLVGLKNPELLRRIERRWMEFAERLSVVMTFVIMLLTFWVVLTPLAILKRIFGSDSLGLKPDPQADSYWVDGDKEGAAKRFYSPY